MNIVYTIDNKRTTQSKYKKKKKPEAQPSIDPNEVCIKNQGHVKRYVDYACSLLEGKPLNKPIPPPTGGVGNSKNKNKDENEDQKKDEPQKFDTIVLKATGRAVNNAVTTAEIVKKRISGLHQVISLETLYITDVWEPQEAGLKEVETKRRVASIIITLSRDQTSIDKKAPGYQQPISPRNIRRRGWQCQKCRLVNRGHDQTCAACLAPRPYISDLLTKEIEEKKMDHADVDIETFWSDLENKLISFKQDYNRDKLQEIWDQNPEKLINKESSLNKEFKKYKENIDKIVVSSKTFSKYIQDIDGMINKLIKPNPVKYKSWNIKEILIWIKGLEDGQFSKHINKLKYGLEKSEIRGEDLPDLTRSDLASQPFDIGNFKDRKLLEMHFKSLRTYQSLDKNQNVNDNEGAPTAYNEGAHIAYI